MTAAVLLNARYAPISISVAPGFHGSVPRRLLESQLIVDESWAVSHRGGGHFDRRILPRVVELLAPAVLAALVRNASVRHERELVVDSRLVGLAAGAAAVAARAPLIAVVVAAPGATAVVRAIT